MPRKSWLAALVVVVTPKVTYPRCVTLWKEIMAEHVRGGGNGGDSEWSSTTQASEHLAKMVGAIEADRARLPVFYEEVMDNRAFLLQSMFLLCAYLLTFLIAVPYVILTRVLDGNDAAWLANFGTWLERVILTVYLSVCSVATLFYAIIIFILLPHASKSTCFCAEQSVTLAEEAGPFTSADERHVAEEADALNAKVIFVAV